MSIGSSLGHRFWQLWAANAISSVGDGMALVALPLVALSETRNALAMAGVMAVGGVPALVAALPVGAFADRTNRRRILVRTELLRFVALALFGVALLTQFGGLAVIYAAALVFGTLAVTFDVTSASILPSIVPRDSLASANSHLMNAAAVGRDITGQAAGGALVAVARSLPFVGDAATFLASALIISKALPDDPPVADRRTSTWADLRVGLKWYFHHPVLRRLTILVTGLAFCQSMVLALMALYARVDLGVPARDYGVLLALSSLGSIFGAFVAPTLARRIDGSRLLVGAALMAACTYPAMALTHSTLVAFVSFGLEAVTVLIGIVASSTLRQQIVPDDMQARSVAAHRTLVVGCVPIAGLVGGVLGSVTGIRTTLFAAGLLQLAFTVAFGLPLIRIHRSSSAAAEEVIPDVVPLSRELAGGVTALP